MAVHSSRPLTPTPLPPHVAADPPAGLAEPLPTPPPDGCAEKLAANDALAREPRERPLRPTPSDAPAAASWVKREPWLAVLLSSFVPVLAAIVLPLELTPKLGLLGVSGSLLLAGLVMLVRRGPASKPDEL